eukprot:2625374-Prymnesium_polylepis.1
MKFGSNVLLLVLLAHAGVTADRPQMKFGSNVLLLVLLAHDGVTADSYSNTVMGQPPSDGITCTSTADCPTSDACAENPVCWTRESPNGQHYCAEQVTPGRFCTTADICNAPNAHDYIQCYQGRAQRYCRLSYYSNTVMGQP